MDTCIQMNVREVKVRVQATDVFGIRSKLTHKNMILTPRTIFVETKMNQVVNLIYPFTSLSTVSAKDVLLSAAAKIRIDTVVLIKRASHGTFCRGTATTCFPRPFPTARVDVMAGTKTAN